MVLSSDGSHFRRQLSIHRPISRTDSLATCDRLEKIIIYVFWMQSMELSPVDEHYVQMCYEAFNPVMCERHHRYVLSLTTLQSTCSATSVFHPMSLASCADNASVM